jgi:Secretion system C-terminal sorting domain/Carbohydrate esterase, sialic acid-specific acetylesterase
MTTITKYFFISILICVNYLSFGQIKLTSPQSRAVYQRNGIGFSAVIVAGSYEKQVDKIEARLVPIQFGQGEDTDYRDWKTIKTVPLNGNFSFIMSVKQGWYRLEVRGSLNGEIIGGVSTVDKFGVGEVFIIAGQSNAEGLDAVLGVFVDNDRVNCLSTLNDQGNGGTDYISLSPFSQLQTNSRIAPRGKNAWCWGRLGELLVNRLNVPVMFFNVAFGGTTSTAWAQTANGNFTINPYIGGVYPNKLPYQNMSDVLKYYVPQLGVRAVLWCQGEADNFTSSANNKAGDEQTYIANIQTVINRTRNETGITDLHWVVSQTSYLSGITDAKIIRAQQAIVQNTPRVTAGPFTDIIQPVGRQDGVHISTELPQLAAAWNSSLTDAFFQSSRPYIPAESSDLAFTCGDNRVEVTLPSVDKYGKRYTDYQWSNNGLVFDNGIFSTQQKVTLNVDGGRQYYARMRDASGNVTQVPAISFKGSNIPVASITASGATDFCEGRQVNLKANDAAIYEWSTGSKNKEITVSTSGSYSVKIINDFGCQSSSSTPTTIVSKPVPPKPTITANSATTFCADSSVTLQSSNQAANSYIWSNGSTSRSQRINTSGSFTVKAVSDQGCVSPESNAVTVTVNPLPATPSIVPNSPTTFCADTNVVLRSSNQDAVAYRWSTGSTSRDITIRNSGNYSVRTIDRNGCVSLQSLATSVRVNPLPSAPTISSTKDTVFCQGENTILNLNIQNGAFPTIIALQEGKTTRYNFQNLNVNISGSFNGFQTDVNGCKSGLSNSIFVSVKPTPAKVSNIVRLSPYSISIENPKANTYTWQFNGANRTDFNGTTVRIKEAGRYRVTAKNIYKTLSYGEKVCSSEPSDEFSFLLYDDNGVSIYPNPSNGNFSIDSRVDWRNSNVEVFSMRGELIKTTFVTVFNDVQKLDLTSLPEGEYMLRIRTDNFFTITKRIIINR